MTLARPILALAVLLCLTLPASSAEPAAKSPEAKHAGEQFFERKIRPVFIEHCHKCHAGNKHQGGLKLDTLGGLLTGGDSGPALVPGDTARSLLIQVIGWPEDGIQMPPSKKLPDAVIADIKQWVQLGAPWPGADPRAAAPPPKRSKEITADDRAYWAFQPLRRPTVPTIANSAGAAQPQPIDAFVQARLAAKQLTANPRASRRELIRRAYFDLLGLPPTPEAVARFEQDTRPDAFARLIDELLERPQYGERWARHWLDVVRYGQTNGYERDSEKQMAWKYRDYVVQAFNSDKPYDRFVQEQLAGDELDDATDDALIATGFYRVGVWDDEPDDARMAEFDGLDDIMVTTGAAFMGLTLGCARCHDHRFDPIPQEDYYRLLTFFRSVRPYTNPRQDDDSPTFVPLGDRRVIAEKIELVRSKSKPLEEQIKQTKDEKEKRKLREQIEQLTRDTLGKLDWALGVRDGGEQATHVLIRGNAGTPGDKVEPGFLSVLGSSTPEIKKPAHASSSGRRLAFARWLTSRDNPLTSRVMVNRVWKHHFGRGIVATTSDLGKGGTPPTHPELLDWLAVEFIERGWSIKQLHKSIMLSETYQRSSRSNNSPALAADPANDLLWRQNLRRIEAEAIRDAVLATSGELNPAMGGRGFFPHLAGEVLAGGSRPGGGWEISPSAEQNRRSIYAFVKRSMVPPLFEGFDYATNASPLAERPVTTVAPQALMLLNDQFMQEQAAALANRLQREAGESSAKQIERLYQLAVSRQPTAREAQLAAGYLQRQTQAYKQLASRVTFAPDVPLSLHNSYSNRLKPQDYLLGPSVGWSYFKGRWGGGYEGIMTVDRDRGPFALWQGPKLADAVIQTRLTLQNAIETGAIVFRAEAERDVFRGYDLAFSPRDESLVLRRHAGESTVLAKVSRSIPTDRPIALKLEFAGPRIRVWFEESKEALLDVTDEQPLLEPGRLGARSWGAAMSFDQLQITTGGQTFDLATAPTTLEPTADGAPPAGWTTYGGAWSVQDGVVTLGPAPGAKGLWNDAQLVDGTIEAEIMLHGENGDAGLVLRADDAKEGTNSLSSYNINLQAGALRLGKHRHDWRELKRVNLPKSVDQWRHVRVELQGPRVRIFVDRAEQPQIEYVDERPLTAGGIGLRTYNAHVSLRNVKYTVGDKTIAAELRPAQVEPPRVAPPVNLATQRALQSLCLAVLNLNEFVYVD